MGSIYNKWSHDPTPADAVQWITDRMSLLLGVSFQLPSSDFAGMTLGLAQLQALAQPAAGGKEWSRSNKEGYQIIFRVYERCYKLWYL